VATSLRCARSIVTAWVAAVCLLPATAAIAGKEQAEASRATLTVEEQKLLEGLFKQGLFDPTGAERVRVKTSVRTPLANSRDIVREAWFQKATAGVTGRVVFLDGEERSVSDPSRLRPVDFIGGCRSRFARAQPVSREEMVVGGFPDRPLGKPVEELDKSPLATAAWLHRLGHDDLAVRALSEARAIAALGEKRVSDEWLITQFHTDLARVPFEEMMNAFMVSADDEALAAGERLTRLYPDETRQFRQSGAILADLHRRKTTGTFGRTRSLQWPAGFTSWDVGKRTAYLIGLLDQVDGHQLDEPGSVVLADDPIVQSLIRIGDPAVPALIAVIENDTRLTRGVQYQQDLSIDRTVLSVREAALDAVMTITGTAFFQTIAAGDNFTRQSNAEARKMARRLTIYWDRYGRLPFDERMMKILTEPTPDFESKRQAATNLAHLGEPRIAGPYQIRFETSPRGRRKALAPAVQKFKHPTIASAILAALDDDLRQFDALPHDQIYEFRRRWIEDNYVQALIDLGDTSIAPELSHRSAAAWQLRQRQLFASAANQLGAPGAMRGFARQVEHAGFQLPANDQTDTRDEDQPGTVALRGIIDDLVRAETPEADRALFAISDPRHPYFSIARSRVTEAEWGAYAEERAFVSHPYCLKILRSELGNRDPTGGMYRREGTKSISLSKDGTSNEKELPAALNNPKLLKDFAFERRCDRAALKLDLLVLGLPAFHPLQKDADARLKELARVFDSFQNGYRLITPLEARFLEVDSGESIFLPNLPPLNRLATAGDVKAGRAVFQLNGQGKLAPIQLPAVAFLRQPQRARRRPRPAIIVQAEIDAGGKTIYGVIGDGAARTACPEDLTDIKPIKRSFFDFLK
jgi:hypothetical protein